MTTAPKYEPHEDPQKLKRLYWGAGLTQRQIANKFGVNTSEVRNAMMRYGIKTRQPDGFDFQKFASYKTDSRGYEVWSAGGTTVNVHQLVAISEGIDPRRLYSEDEIIHHKNGIPWDNRPSNLQVMSRSAHSKHHHEVGDITPPDDPEWYTDEELLSWIDAYVEEFGIAPSAAEANVWPGPTDETYRSRFGSFPDAVKEAGYKPRSE